MDEFDDFALENAMNYLMDLHHVRYLRSLLQVGLQAAAEACFSLFP